MIETLRYFCGHLKIKELNFICTWIELQRYKTNKKYMAAFKIILDLQNYFGKKKKGKSCLYCSETIWFNVQTKHRYNANKVIRITYHYALSQVRLALSFAAKYTHNEKNFLS